MAYHNGTIQLIADQKAIKIQDFRGLPVDLDQVRKSIHELDQFLASRTSAQGSASWEKGTLMVPTDAQLKSSSARDMELWARHMDSEGKTPPPGFEAADGFRDERKMLAQARTIHAQMLRHMTIAHLMVNRQQRFLQTGNWMDKTRLTILEIAEHLPEWGEKTVRDSVHNLNFTLSGHTFAADTLICASEMPALCKHIAELMEMHPRAGAPLLTEELEENGIHVSRRMVGNALQLIARHQARQLA
jgi:hypothetical protein